MVREALEDFKRHKDDQRVNSRQCSVLRGAEWVPLAWSKLRVGDVVRCANHEEFPADLMLVASAKEQVRAAPSNKAPPPDSYGAYARLRMA